MLTKKNKQLILQVQVAVVFLQSILITWLIKSEWSNHTGVVIGAIMYIGITDYIFYKATLIIINKIKKYKRDK